MASRVVWAFLSELVGPWTDTEGTGRGGDRDVAAAKKILLLRPKCGFQRSCPAQPALCAGTEKYIDIDLVFPDFPIDIICYHYYY